MLSDWAHTQRKAVGLCKQHKDVKKHQQFPQLQLSKHLRKVLGRCQGQLYSQKLLSILPNQHSNMVNRICTAKQANKGKLGTSAVQHPKIQEASCLLSLDSWAQYINDQYLHQPAKVSNQSHLSRVHIKQIIIIIIICF